MVHGCRGCVQGFIPHDLSVKIVQHYRNQLALVEERVGSAAAGAIGSGIDDSKELTTAMSLIAQQEESMRGYLAAMGQRLEHEFVRSSQNVGASADGQGILGALPLPNAPVELWDATDRYKPVLVYSSRGGPTVPLDDAATALKTHFEATDRFNRDTFGEYPVGNRSHLMRGYTHDYRAFNNAFWSSQDESTHYGEVDPRIFSPLWKAYDVIVHEYGHAMTEHTAGLRYENQSGALNESASDVFGICADQQAKGQTDPNNANWFIGKVIKGDRGNGALRSMDHPGTGYKDHPILHSDPQPDSMGGYKPLPNDADNDWGGVHLYSGIPNRAFALAAKALAGPSWGKPAKIWFQALNDAAPNDSFAVFAGRTIAVAKLHGSAVENAVRSAWHTVGVI